MRAFDKWAKKHDISETALHELSEMFGFSLEPIEPEPLKLPVKSEAAIQTDARLAASRNGGRLWRNNVGAAMSQDNRMIRYGLCNESKQMNQSIKSSDLIGIQPITITPEHVGSVIGQFMAIEVKAGDWVFTGTERELAQLKFINLVHSLGGYSKFITDSACV